MAQYLRVTPSDPSTDRSKIYAGQTCHRTSFLLPSKGWLLQQALSGLQEVGRMETSNRSVLTKSACNHSSFQDGNFGLGLSFFTEARLGHFPRLERCIFSHTNSSQVKEVSSFSLHGENIPVSSLAIRPGSSSLHVLQNCEGSSQTLSSHGHASTFLSRRLAPAVSISSDVFVSQRSTTEHGFVPVICSQLGQIRASSQSEVFFSGSTFLSRGWTDRPFFGQVNKTGNLDSENAVSCISISQTDSFPSGSNGIYGSSLARCRAHKLQWCIKDCWSQVDQSWDYHISLGPWCNKAVFQWLNRDFLFTMVPLCRPQPDLFLFKDASLVGWGAHKGDLSASGLWSAYWHT